MTEYDAENKKPGTVLSTGLKPPSSNFSIVRCPFCKQSLKAFHWSLAGGGKKCQCGAKMDISGAFAPPIGKVYDPARLKFITQKGA